MPDEPAVTEPYWLAHAGPDRFPPPPAVPRRTAVAVVGGGLMGVSTGYWLARSGVAVVVLERGRLAGGATGRNAGLVLHNSRPIEDAALVVTVLAEERIDAGYQRCGHLALSSDPLVWQRVRDEVAARPAGAPPLRALDHGACEDLLGLRVAATCPGGRWSPGGRAVHPVRLVRGLAEAARRRGAVIAQHTVVHAVTTGSAPGELVVRTSRGELRAEQVVFACGASAGRFVHGLGGLLREERGHMLATAPLPELFRPGMGVDRGSVYWRQHADGTIVLGGDGPADETWRTLERFLPTAFPGFPAFTVTGRWYGVMDHSEDGLPLVGPVPHAGGRWVIAGFGGHGLPGGIGAGRALAEAITTGTVPPDLAPYSLDRFVPAPTTKGAVRT